MANLNHDIDTLTALPLTRSFDDCTRTKPERLTDLRESLDPLQTDLPCFHIPHAPQGMRSIDHGKDTRPSVMPLKYERADAFQVTPVTDNYNLGRWAGSVLRSDSEMHYVQKGLQDLTRYLRPEVDPLAPTTFMTCNSISYDIDRDGSPFSCYVSDIYFCNTQMEKWYSPAWSWDNKRTLGDQIYTQTVLNHLIWSTYSWCCKRVGQSTISEQELLKCLGDNWGPLTASCRELCEGLRFLGKKYVSVREYRFQIKSMTWLEGSTPRFDLFPQPSLEQPERLLVCEQDFRGRRTTRTGEERGPPTTVSDPCSCEQYTDEDCSDSEFTEE